MKEKEKNNTEKSDMRLNKLRNNIDDLDSKLLDLINRRLLIGQEIGKIKEQEGKQILDKSREQEILQRLSKINTGPLRDKTLNFLFNNIFSESREIQRPQVITYLGPEATFTHIAAMNHFGYSVQFVPQHSIRDVFREAEKGKCNYGVVPVENSIEGSVNYTLDLFFESELRICAEEYLAISHDLLSVQGVLDDIKVVYSHPQPFGQCRGWLRKNLLGVTLKECNSTAEAAKKALDQPESAAIASSEAAQLYGLQVVVPGIEDFSRNTTRFLIIGKDDVGRTGTDKTSIMFAAPHVPGALFKVLEPIAKGGVNMLKLESRPARDKNWSYFFFVDLEGHIEDTKIKMTVDAMKEICLFLKFLGSYPRLKGQL